MKKLVGKLVAGILTALVALSCVGCGALMEKVECGYCGEKDYKYKMSENPILECYVCEDCVNGLKGN